VKIGYLQKTSFIDYPGRISAIVFTQGCNFRCPYCHNPELVIPQLFTDPVPEEKVIDFLSRRTGKLDGVVITGGEPTIHHDLPDFLMKMKSMGFKVKLDTNGTNPDMLRQIIQENIVDYIAMDVKAPLDKYSAVVCSEIDQQTIAQSIRLIIDAGCASEFRTTLAKSLLQPEDVMRIGELIQGSSMYVLQSFVPSKHVDQEFIHETNFNENEIMHLIDGLSTLVDSCILR